MGISHLNFLDVATRNLANISIGGYQKFISPHKGFSCAHRLLYGDESCSHFFNRIIAEQGLGAALKISRSRFQACREANLILRHSGRLSAKVHLSKEESQEQNKREQKRENFNIDGCDTCGDLASIVPDCSGFDCGSPDLSGLDCSGCHSLDLSGCDCGALDCGSCSG